MMKKSEMIVSIRAVKDKILPVVAAGLLAAAVVAGSAVGLTSCKNPAGPGGNENNENQQGSWGDTVWHGDAAWQAWATKVESTSTTPGIGYRNKVETGTDTHTNGETRPQTRIVDTETKEIPAGCTLRPDGYFVLPGQEKDEGVLGWKWEWTGVTDWRVDEKDPNKEREWKEQVKVLADGTHTEAKQFVPTEHTRDKEITNDPTGTYTEPEYGMNVDTVLVIANYNGGDAEIHNSMTAGEAGGVIDSLGNRLPAQAEALRAVFDGVIKNAEAEIKNIFTSNNGIKAKDRPALAEAQRTVIINEIFKDNSTDRTVFDRYYNAYTSGQYLMSSDWNTRASGAVTDKEDEFKGYRDPLASEGLIPATVSGTYLPPRGAALNIGSSISVTAQFTAMENAMQSQIITALGIENNANNQNIAKALIIQLFQDLEEQKAFIEDIVAEGLANAYNYDGENILASASPQSAVRLAAVSPEANFDPNAIKTSYGKPFEQYTGNYTPCKPSKKDEMAV
jgi:hypothetical protein